MELVVDLEGTQKPRLENESWYPTMRTSLWESVNVQLWAPARQVCEIHPIRLPPRASKVRPFTCIKPSEIVDIGGALGVVFTLTCALERDVSCVCTLDPRRKSRFGIVIICWC